jgi:hypothetical protein
MTLSEFSDEMKNKGWLYNPVNTNARFFDHAFQKDHFTIYINDSELLVFLKDDFEKWFNDNLSE